LTADRLTNGVFVASLENEFVTSGSRIVLHPGIDAIANPHRRLKSILEVYVNTDQELRVREWVYTGRG
jgi:hypothetical protein